MALYFRPVPYFASALSLLCLSLSSSVYLMTTTGLIIHYEKSLGRKYRKWFKSEHQVNATKDSVFQSWACILHQLFVTIVSCCTDVLTWYSSMGYCPCSDRCACVCVRVCAWWCAVSPPILQTSYRIITLQKDHSFFPSVAFLIHLSSFSQSVPRWEQLVWQVWMGICVNAAVSMWMCVCVCVSVYRLVCNCVTPSMAVWLEGEVLPINAPHISKLLPAESLAYSKANLGLTPLQQWDFAVMFATVCVLKHAFHVNVCTSPRSYMAPCVYPSWPQVHSLLWEPPWSSVCMWNSFRCFVFCFFFGLEYVNPVEKC